MELWEILVPTMRADGRPYKARYHRVWDKYVRDITGGMTIMTPVKGQWVQDGEGEIFEERMIPVRIAINDQSELERILEVTKHHYKDQIAIFACKIGDVLIVENDLYDPGVGFEQKTGKQ